MNKKINGKSWSAGEDQQNYELSASNFRSNRITQNSMHQLFCDYIQRVNGHRNLCNVIDFMYHSSGAGTSAVKSKVYVISESYNLSLQDLYSTS